MAEESMQWPSWASVKPVEGRAERRSAYRECLIEHTRAIAERTLAEDDIKNYPLPVPEHVRNRAVRSVKEVKRLEFKRKALAEQLRNDRLEAQRREAEKMQSWVEYRAGGSS